MQVQAFYKIIDIVEDGNDMEPARDYAILKLEGNPGDIYGWRKTGTYTNNNIMIIQHPQGEPKQLDAGTIAAQNNPYIEYRNLDTEPGSSGSGILNSKGCVVGVHTNGGCDYHSNSGVDMNAIYSVSNVLPISTQGNYGNYDHYRVAIQNIFINDVHDFGSKLEITGSIEVIGCQYSGKQITIHEPSMQPPYYKEKQVPRFNIVTSIGDGNCVYKVNRDNFNKARGVLPINKDKHLLFPKVNSYPDSAYIKIKVKLADWDLFQFGDDKFMELNKKIYLRNVKPGVQTVVLREVGKKMKSEIEISYEISCLSCD